MPRSHQDSKISQRKDLLNIALVKPFPSVGTSRVFVSSCQKTIKHLTTCSSTKSLTFQVFSLR